MHTNSMVPTLLIVDFNHVLCMNVTWTNVSFINAHYFGAFHSLMFVMSAIVPLAGMYPASGMVPGIPCQKGLMLQMGGGLSSQSL